MFLSAPLLRRSPTTTGTGPRRYLFALALGMVTAVLGPPGMALADERAMPAFDGGHGLNVTATAYTSGPESTGKRPGHPQFGLTFTGTHATEGHTIAVDPNRIPLGSRVYIHELHEFRVAEDIGGAIRGDRIDLYMEKVSDALQWGVRRVRIQVYPKI